MKVAYGQQAASGDYYTKPVGGVTPRTRSTVSAAPAPTPASASPAPSPPPPTPAAAEEEEEETSEGIYTTMMYVTEEEEASDELTMDEVRKLVDEGIIECAPTNCPSLSAEADC